MLYFLLPSIQYNLPNLFDIQFKDENINEDAVISNSLKHYLNDIKTQIHEHESDWDIYKKITNPYEYIHTAIPDKKKSICKYKPLSRSYFKMIEIVTYFHLLDKRFHEPFRSFHLAEGPGGFIEALCHLRNNKNDKYIGMTILNDEKDPNIPGWKKSQQFLKENENVYIENGKDGTGNIMSLDNFDYCYEKYRESMDICTGDGGFDFSMDFNHQEQNISTLLFGQIAYALIMQKYKGSFILKIFDCFSYHTIDLLGLLSSCYEKVYVTKPQTSRYANSEKYIVCKNFIHKNTSKLYQILRIQLSIILKNDNKLVKRYLHYHYSSFFINKLEECNAIFGQQQIESIYNTISMIIEKQTNHEELIQHNIQKCMVWCNKYNVAINNVNY